MLITIAGFAFSVGLLIYLTVRWHWPSFLALLVASYTAGLSFGLSPDQVTSAVMKGFGTTLGDIGLTIALGALLGFILEYCGATISIARGVVSILGGRFPGIALAITGYIVSIPIYCDSGFIILNSMRRYLAKTHHVSPVFLSTVLSTALYATHTLVLPTPGPLIAAINFQLTGYLPIVLMLGLVLSLLAAVTGFVWALCVRNLVPARLESEMDGGDLVNESSNMPFLTAITPIMTPMLLITAGGIAGHGDSIVSQWIGFFGQPVNALLAGLATTLPLLKYGLEGKLQVCISKGLEAGGKIVLIVGCGGAFGYVLQNSELTELFTRNPGFINLGLFLPFVMAAIIKTAEGSTTVALITASALANPLLPALGLDTTTGRLFALFACSAGAMTIAHVNDSYFWVITEFTGMDTATALKSITVATFLQGVVVLLAVQLLAFFLDVVALQTLPFLMS